MFPVGKWKFLIENNLVKDTPNYKENNIPGDFVKARLLKPKNNKDFKKNTLLKRKKRLQRSAKAKTKQLLRDKRDQERLL